MGERRIFLKNFKALMQLERDQVIVKRQIEAKSCLGGKLVSNIGNDEEVSEPLFNDSDFHGWKQEI